MRIFTAQNVQPNVYQFVVRLGAIAKFLDFVVIVVGVPAVRHKFQALVQICGVRE